MCRAPILSGAHRPPSYLAHGLRIVILTIMQFVMSVADEWFNLMHGHSGMIMRRKRLSCSSPPHSNEFLLNHLNLKQQTVSRWQFFFHSGTYALINTLLHHLKYKMPLALVPYFSFLQVCLFWSFQRQALLLGWNSTFDLSRCVLFFLCYDLRT